VKEEEINVLYNEILKLPKVEKPINTTTQCELNIDDLFETIRVFKDIPNYNELIKDNRKKGKEIERLNNTLNKLDKVIIDFKKQIEEERKNYHKIIGNFVDKIQELKGSDK